VLITTSERANRLASQEDLILQIVISGRALEGTISFDDLVAGQADRSTA
jgi:hypothetical protein